MKTSFPKQSLKLIALGFLVCVLVFLYFTGSFQNKVDPTDLASNLTAQPGAQSEKGFLVRLKIPRLEVNADIEHVGLTLAGAMDVPKDAWDVAWFQLGPRPGEEGSAVIAGHRDSSNGKAAVFYYLDKLVPGDLVTVEDDQGKITSFVVRETRVYDAAAQVPEVFSSESGTHLNLITCDGSWNKFTKSYAKRLVVFTDILE